MKVRQIVNPQDPIQIRDMNEMFRELYTITARNNAALSGSVGGWNFTNCDWACISTQNKIYTISTVGDKSSLFSPGMRVRLVQSSVVSYYIIISVSYSSGNTHLDLFSGNGVGISSGSISDVYYSRDKAPVGFPLDPRKWSIRSESNIDIYKNNPEIYVWYYFGSNTCINLPKGLWRLRYSVLANMYDADTSQIRMSINSALSENQSSVTIPDSLARMYIEMNSTGAKYCEFYISREVIFEQDASGYIYLLGRTRADGVDYLRWRGVFKPTVIEAECAYL